MEPLHRKYQRLTNEVLLKIKKYAEQEGLSICSICVDSGFNTKPECHNCKNKNKTPRQIIIESHIPMVIMMARRLSTPTHFKDVLSAGLLALTEAVNKMPKDVRCVSGYLNVYIVQEMKRFMLQNTVIRVPPDAASKYDWLRHITYFDGDVAVPGNQAEVEINEVLDLIPQNTIQKTILKCLVEGGYSGSEMATSLNITQARVSQVKQELILKLLEVFKK